MRKSLNSVIKGVKINVAILNKRKTIKVKKKIVKKKGDRLDVLLRLLEIKESQWHDDDYEGGKGDETLG